MAERDEEELMKAVGLGVCVDCAIDQERKAAAMLVGGTSLCAQHGVRARQIQKGAGR